MFVQRMFCNGKKNYTYGFSLKNGIGQEKKFVLFSLFFSVLIVIVHACLYREGDIFVFLFEMEPEKTVAVDKMDLCFRPSTSESNSLTSFDPGIEWPLCTAWLCWLVGPDPILSVALCTSSYLTT